MQWKKTFHTHLLPNYNSAAWMTMGNVFISSKSFKTCENRKSSVTFSKAVQRAAIKPFLGCFCALELCQTELTSDPYVCTTWQSMRKEMSKSRARTDADLANGKEENIHSVSIPLKDRVNERRNSLFGTCHSCIWTHILPRWCAWETH